MTKPVKPFEVNYAEARPGERQLPAKWSAPFDEVFREVQVPNAPEKALLAYASIGAHVVEHATEYTPAYKILFELTLPQQKNPDLVRAWEASAVEHSIAIIDRRIGKSTRLMASFSTVEAIVSWFSRAIGMDDAVLCHDKKDDTWYIESMKLEYIISLGKDGTEVAVDEADAVHQYRIDQHPNGFMVHGD
jgi:hypothetical protein